MSKCWYCNNELTSGDSPKHFGICNKCYDEMFKSSDTIISSFTNKISDLEAKLAESEKRYEDRKQFCISETRSQLEIINNLLEENQQLKQQLAEYSDINNALNKGISEKCILCEGQHNQDKISFAVEQLEKLKEFFLEEHRDEEMDTDYLITKDAGAIADYLLDQIEQLKEGK